MIKEKLLDFYSYIENFNDYNYLLAVLSLNTAPTSSGKKSGSMVNLKNYSRELASLWYLEKSEISRYLGVEFFELKSKPDSVLIYFFRNENLLKHLNNKKIKNYLDSIGYKNCRNIEDYLRILRDRFEDCCPHEVGIFLGYPLEDVVDFIDCKKKSPKCSGYWKCYNNEEYALRTFKIFDDAKIEQMDKILNLAQTHLDLHL